MSRSFTRNPAGSVTTARSEKDDKREWHRAFRRACTVALVRGEELLPDVREESDPWVMAKDGKLWHGGPGEGPRIAQDRARRRAKKQNADEPRQSS